MKRQSSEGRSTTSTKSPQNHHQRNNSGLVASNQSNDTNQIPGAKKVISFSRNTNRNSPIKVINREISPAHYSVQKTEPCESVSQRLDSSMNGVENRGKKSNKGQRVPVISKLSLRAVSDKQLNEFGLKKPLSAADFKGLKDLKMKKTVSLNINVGMANKVNAIGPKSATNPSAQFQFFEKNKTEISDAIFERDEIDEEDNKEHYHYNATPEPKVASADQTMISSQLHRDLNTNSQESTDSPLMLKMDNNSNIYNFKLGNPMISDPITPGLNIEFDKSTSSTKLSIYNRGAFMNEHITFNEFEKQKEKKRQMKEALDFQLNEKKRKQEEQKLKEKELAKKEEERIKREVAQLNKQFEKESALEQSRKPKLKTEEIENVSTNQSNSKMTPVNKPEKHSSESDKNETRDTSMSSAHLRYMSPTKEEEKILKSPVKVQRNTSRQNKDVVDSPLRFNGNMDLLADENKKLRDENTKKGELIDALISVLKQKDVGNFPNLPERNGLYSQSRKDEGNSHPPSKVLRPLDIGEPEADPNGFTFGGYNQSKSKYRIASEQPSEVNRYNTGESNRPITEDRLPVSIYDRMEPKDYQPKLIRPVMPEFLVEYTNANGGGRDNPSYFKPPNTGLRNSEIAALFGHSNTRGYSSPLANPLSQSNIISPAHKNDSRNSPLLPSFFTPNSNHLGFGPFNLEPIKALSQSSATSPKGGFVLTSPLMSPTGSTVVRIKKRHEHSVDLAELNRENHQVRPTFLHEDGSFSLIRPNRAHKREVSGLSYSSVAHGGQSHKIEMVDTYQAPSEDRNTSATLETIHENEGNMNIQPRILGKVIFSGNGAHKKMIGGVARDKWMISDSNSLKRNQEELIEKMKALPSLEGKSKFPKDVFSSNIKKKACP